MSELDNKINEHFSGLVVRKDLVKAVKGNAIVPSYVLEYLLGQYCATSDEASIQSGIETVKEILRKHYVHRNESGLVKSITKEKGRHKVIDKISVSLNDKSDMYEATFANLGISKVIVDSDTIKKHPKFLPFTKLNRGLERAINRIKPKEVRSVKIITPIQHGQGDKTDRQLIGPVAMYESQPFSTEAWVYVRVTYQNGKETYGVITWQNCD